VEEFLKENTAALPVFPEAVTWTKLVEPVVHIAAPDPELLPKKVVFVTAPPDSESIAPPKEAVFEANVLPVTVRVPPSLRIAPPAPLMDGAVFEVNVLLVATRLSIEQIAPPPPPLEVFDVNVLPVTESAP
jgi:hypothetical protein